LSWRGVVSREDPDDVTDEADPFLARVSLLGLQRARATLVVISVSGSTHWHPAPVAVPRAVTGHLLPAVDALAASDRHGHDDNTHHCHLTSAGLHIFVWVN
jgi:hypothetical protein